MGHPQPATKVKTDNMTARSILTGTIKQKRSKAIDMRFYWLKDQQEQGQLDIIWEPGKQNLADYSTKHHAVSHHRILRCIYLFVPGRSPTNKKECIKILDQLQDPQKIVIKSMDKGQTANLTYHAPAQPKRGVNGILMVICQLLKSIPWSQSEMTNSIVDLQNTKIKRKLNYLKHVIKSRRDSQYSHKVF